MQTVLRATVGYGRNEAYGKEWIKLPQKYLLSKLSTLGRLFEMWLYVLLCGCMFCYVVVLLLCYFYVFFVSLSILIVMYVPFCVIVLFCVLDNCHRDIGALLDYPN
jgi:hypothetical protein